MRILFALMLCAAAVMAADVNGKWTAQMPGRGGETMQATFNFKADGDKLTGSVTSPRGEAPIADGKINGDEISFTQTFSAGGNEMKILYKGKVSGNEIRFTRRRDGGQGRAQEFTAKRAS